MNYESIKNILTASNPIVWVNGKKILSYEKGNQMWEALISHSKFAQVKNFAGGDGGHILLQAHHDEVHYRNLKIREL